MPLDCRWCGACCCSPKEMLRAGHAQYVAVEPCDVMVENGALMARFAVQAGGGHYLRMTAEGRCAALEGRIGRRVDCVIYDERPSGCREVEAGSNECLRRRRQQGL